MTDAEVVKIEDKTKPVFMLKSFKYRLYPTKDQKPLLEGILNLCCWLYNTSLHQKIYAYKHCGKFVSYHDQSGELEALVEEIPEFKAVYSQTRQDVLRRNKKAFDAFFKRLKTGKGKSGFPRFKSGKRYDSFSYPQSGFKLDEDSKRVYLSKVGSLKVKLHRPTQGRIKTCIVKREVDKWFVIFSCEIECKPKVDVKTLTTDDVVGIDVGITTFAALSDDIMVESHKYYKQSQKKLRVAQRSLSRKKKGSKRRRKQVNKVAKLYGKVKRQREYYQHKVSSKIIKDYKVVGAEALKIQNMLQNHKLAKSISDMAWGGFFNKLAYKAAEAGRLIVFVNPNGTSQRCSRCGAVVKKDLSVRWHECPNCGLSVDRDINSAYEIKRLVLIELKIAVSGDGSAPVDANVAAVSASVVPEAPLL